MTTSTTSTLPAHAALARNNLLRLAVLAPDGLWLQPRLVAGLPRAARQIASGFDQPDLLAILAQMAAHDLGQAWVWPGSAPIPDAAMVAAAGADGWNIQAAQSTSDHAYGAWVSAARPGSPIRQVYYPAADYQHPYFRPTADQTPLHLTRTLACYTLALGGYWYRSASATGMAHMRAALRSHQYDLKPTDIPMAMRDPNQQADGGLSWARDLSDRERARGRYLVALDRNGAWLGAAGMAMLGVGAPMWIHNDATNVYTNLASVAKAGVFRLRMLDLGPTAATLHLPLPLVNYSTERWISKPTLDLITEWGGRYEIAEAYIQTETHRALEPWYKRLRDARLRLVTGGDLADGAALDLLKLSYVKPLGMLGHGGGPAWDRQHDPLYRPDWYAHVKALARANMLRKALSVARDTHLAPFGVAVDCWYYLLEDADQLDGHYALGTALHQWKRAVYDLADHPDLAAFLTNGTNDELPPVRRLSKVRQALDALDAARVA